MAAAAVASLACPLRRSTRLTSRRSKQDDDAENEIELTPRALRALKRQRHIHIPPPPKKRRRISPSKQHSSDPRPPSPDTSPSLPGHDRPPSPPPLPDPPQDFTPPPLDSLIPFDAFHTLPPPPPQQPLDLQDQFHSFPQQQLYVPPPLFVRDREINIWKLACQERVDCLLRRYGIDYIKALVRSEARCHSPPSSSATKFCLYTPASYTYSTSWDSSSRSRKPFPVDDDHHDHEVSWPIDDPDWPDADVDMDDDDDDDDEDEDDSLDPEAVRDGDKAVQLTGEPSNQQVESPPKPEPMMLDDPPLPANAPPTPDPPPPPDAPRPLTPHLYLPPPQLTPPSLPPLSSLHVPLLSEPPRAFMGRGTPPDRRRLIEWSGSARFAPNGMGPPLYLSPVPQRPPDSVGPMPVDPPMPSQSPPTNGEWTSFLFSMLEGDGMGVSPEPTWYELGPGASPLELPLAHPRPDQEDSSSSTLRFALG